MPSLLASKPRAHAVAVVLNFVRSVHEQAIAPGTAWRATVATASGSSEESDLSVASLRLAHSDFRLTLLQDFSEPGQAVTSALQHLPCKCSQ